MSEFTNSEVTHYTHIMDSFEFEYGKIQENVEVEYFTSGIPKYDCDGYITNAVIFCPTFKGENSVLKGAQKYLERESKFKRNDFYFIVITSLGVPNSCSPSFTGLNYKFPHYNMNDRINFKRQFLREKFKIKKLFGLMGEGIGGYEVFTWACDYPDEMEFILISNSAFKNSGYRYVLSKGFEAIIESTDEFYSDEYSITLSKIVVAINTFIFANSLSDKMFSNLSNDELDFLLEDFVDEGLFMDIYDFKYRNACIIDYDVESKLHNIKAKSLIIYSHQNVYFDRSNDIAALNDYIDDVRIFYFESKKENYFDEEDYSLVGKEIISFLDECFKAKY